MAATPARIGFSLREFARAVAEDADVLTRHGSVARQSDDPVPTFFDDEADAQAIADARLSLLSNERRKFRVVVQDEAFPLGLDYKTSVPQGQYIDTERQIDGSSMLMADFSVDLASDTATVTLWG